MAYDTSRLEHLGYSVIQIYQLRLARYTTHQTSKLQDYKISSLQGTAAASKNFLQLCPLHLKHGMGLKSDIEEVIH